MKLLLCNADGEVMHTSVDIDVRPSPRCTVQWTDDDGTARWDFFEAASVLDVSGASSVIIDDDGYCLLTPQMGD